MLQKRDRGLALFWMLLFFIQPIAISYGVSIATDWTQETEIAYNVTDAGDGMSHTAAVHNATTVYWKSQSTIDTYVNETNTIVFPTLVDIDDVAAPDWVDIWDYKNITGLDLSGLSSIVIEWNYIGTGNVTGVAIGKTAPYYMAWGTEGEYLTVSATTATTINNNGTVTFTPETFQALQLDASALIRTIIIFNDDANLPSSGDYLELSVTFYESTLVFTAEQVVQIAAGILIILDVIFMLAITGIWNPRKRMGT